MLFRSPPFSLRTLTMDRAHLQPALLGAALATATTLALTTLLFARRPAAAVSDAPSSSDEGTPEDEDGKRYHVRREYYDNTGTWMAREAEEEEKKR